MSEIHEKFKKNGYVISDISSVFGFQLEEILREVENADKTLWTQVINNNGLVQDIRLDDEIVSKEHELAVQKLYENKFCYSFKRIICDDRNEYFHKILRSFLLSNDFSNYLYSITRIRIRSVPILYVNAFSNGDFLTTHCDEGLDFGVVISLTKEWNFCFGGLTFILDSDRENIIDVITPRFATLIVLDTKNKLTPHFVSSVSSPSEQSRVSIVARYDAL